MKTETLRNLVTSFESDRAYLETVARFEANPARQVWAGQRAGMVAMIVGQIRGEIMSRDTPDARPSGAAQQFESYLERVLEDYLDMGDSGHAGRVRTSAKPSDASVHGNRGAAAPIERNTGRSHKTCATK